MKHKSFFSRMVGNLSIPVFAAIGGGLVAVLLFSLLIAFENAYRTHVMVDPNYTELPLPILIGMLSLAILVAAAACYALARYLQRSIEQFTRYMLSTRGHDESDLEGMHFPELRRLRVSTTRTVRNLRRENAILRAVAYTDPVTGLPNATALEEAITATLSEARFEAPAAFLLLDIDQFNRALEQAGGGAGDRLLRTASERLIDALDGISGPAAAARRGAFLAAVTADRFALYLPQAVSRDHVVTIARAIRQSFAEPFQHQGRPVSLALSGGIVMAPEDADTAAKLMHNAKLALKLARQDGQSGIRFFTPRLTRIVRGRYRLESELREAVENREFRAVYQPKVDFSTGRIVGAEALARWRRSNGKLISPAAFIPLAEETGLIEQIGEQILDAACEAARTWQNEGHDITVAINVSPSQFRNGDLTEVVMRALRRTGLHANRLELEITESMAVADPARVAEFISPLRALGTKLAIDDFGTGHSNLATLTQLPFDVFKIDRQFVSALDTDRQAPAIVEMILAMAETLGLKTVAEGVETTKQAEFLRRRGCSMAQGFLYSPGLPDTAFLDLVRAWRTPDGLSSSQGVRL